MLKVLIAEDTATIRFILKKILNADPDIEVIGEAANGKDAVEMTQALKPDLVTMDIRMPEMNGFEATQEIMRLCPTPILVISASVQADDLNITFNAIKAGALDIVEKPKGNLSFDFEKIGKRIVQKVKILSEVRVIRRRGSSAKSFSIKSKKEVKETVKQELVEQSHVKLELVSIVSSTGGPKALLVILKKLGKDFPVPIVIVQHITPGFGQGLVDWLDGETDFAVKFASENERLEAGKVYFAKDDHHIRLTADMRVKLSRELPVVGLRPYGNYLFDSVAQNIGKRSIGVILTGMGRDGAEGIRKMKDAGSITIGQDEQTCVVYGMPREAAAVGGLSVQLPLDEIPAQLLKLVQGTGE